MRSIENWLSHYTSVVLLAMATVLAFVLTTAGVAFGADGDLDPSAFIQQVLDAFKALGGLPWSMKVATICLLVVASMKVSFLRTLLWDKLGAFKAILAPALGLLGGLLAYLSSGAPITLPGLVAYFIAGAGALALHELLDALKALPGISIVANTVISWLMALLGAPKPAQ